MHGQRLVRNTIQQPLQANPIYEIAGEREEQWETFSIAVPSTPLQDTVVGSCLTSVAIVLVAWGVYADVARLFRGGKKTNEGWSTMHHTSDMETIKQLLVVLESKDSSISAAKASDALLKLLTAFHDRKIS